MRPSAETLYKSVEEFKKLPDYLQVWPAHGSGSACGKALGAVPESTVGYETRFSVAFKASTSEDSFVDFILDGQPEPPLYFGRMKAMNKVGPKVLGDLPIPERFSINEMVESELTIIDTRFKHEFVQGHLKDSIMASFDKNFNTIAGSFVDGEDEFYLIIDEDNLEEAIRDLINVGLDRPKGFATIDDLKNYNGSLKSIKAVDFKELNN